MAAEDAELFPSHSGFNLKAISHAWASTITQQVAKNLFLWPGRSYLHKARIGQFRL